MHFGGPHPSKPSKPSEYVNVVCMTQLKYGTWRDKWQQIEPNCTTPKQLYSSHRRLIFAMHASDQGEGPWPRHCGKGVSKTHGPLPWLKQLKLLVPVGKDKKPARGADVVVLGATRVRRAPMFIFEFHPGALHPRLSLAA